MGRDKCGTEQSGFGAERRSWLGADIITGLHCSHYLSRLLYKIYHDADVPPEPFALADWDNAQPIPKGRPVFAIVQDDRLDFFVGIEFGFDVSDGVVIGMGPLGTGGHVRAGQWNVGRNLLGV